MKVAMCHFRYGMSDGVSLEMVKWKQALEQLGHEVLIVAGEDPTGKAQILPELSLHYAEGIRRNAFSKLSAYTPQALAERVKKEADLIAERFGSLLRKEGVELLILENLWSLPINLPAALGTLQAVVRLDLPAIAHHHDFWWERDIYQPTCPEVAEILRDYFPPRYGRARHVVINSLAQRELRRRRGIEATVVPNVIDFDEPWETSGSNASLREELGFSLEDIVFLQATRIVTRKGIEIALDLVHHFQHEVLPRLRIPGKGKRALLFLPNLIEDRLYYEKLTLRAEKLGVKTVFVPERFRAERAEKNGKTYSFWDAYAVADFVTYPSLVEGWGNQFLEAVKAKLPLAVFEYPVFKADIAPCGFRYVSLGDRFTRDADGLALVPEEVIHRAAQETGKILADADLRGQIVEHNFSLGRANFSLARLQRDLDKILEEAVA
jgi:glycosyltransferase involved in cell wall biosynthesis